MALLNFQHSQEELWRTGCGEGIYRRDTPKGHNQTGFNLLNLSTLKLVIQFGDFFHTRTSARIPNRPFARLALAELHLLQ
jgi:hypothetical protein